MKVKNSTNRLEGYETKKETTKKDKLREPLELDEKVLVLAERLRKTDTPKNIYKSQQQMFVFLVEKKNYN